MSRYGGGGHRGMRLTGKILGWLLVIVAVAAAGLGGGVWLYLDRTVAELGTPHSASQQEVIDADVLEVPVPGEPAVMLVVGADVRLGPEQDAGRSDTVMLIRADPKRDTVSMLSFPRDLEVDHPGCKRHPDPWRDKINTAYAYCGELGVLRTVQQLTGIRPNYLVTVNFHGFKEIVNKVGGVYVDVDHRYFNDDSGPGGYATINVQPGYQRLTGGAALDYARYRHGDSDFHRIVRQQQFVKALKQSVQTSFSVSKLPGVVSAVSKAVFVGRGGGKRVSVQEALGYAQFLYELPAGNVFQVQLHVQGDYTVTTTDADLSTAVRNFLYPDTTAAGRASAASSGKKPAEPALSPAATLIEVQNGNGVTGDAQLAAELLHEQGYSISTTGDADRFDYFETVVQYNPDVAGAAAAAKTVADLFAGKPEEAPPAAELGENALRVILGSTFHGTIGQAQPQEEVDTEEASVVRDFSAVLPYLREARGSVSFPVLVPTVRDTSSSLDTVVPVRTYRIEDPDGTKHDALRIVYQRGVSYWGVQQTSWTEAPILQGYNGTRKVGKRTLWLYFDGARLNMVAFVENGTAYWVTNTLDSGLSNRSLIAIAKGLQPLSAFKGA